MNKLFLVLYVLISTAAVAQLSPAKYVIKNLKVNTKNGDFATSFYGENKIVLSSSRRTSNSVGRWDGNKQPFLELFIGEIDGKGNISKTKLFSNTLSSKYHEAMVVFSPDLKYAYFTANNLIDGELRTKGLKIFRATVSEEGKWEDITTLSFNSDTYDTGHPSISKDGKKMYFISNMPGGYGDTDIYVVDINRGHYGTPKNLGPTVNTKHREFTPYVDGDVLYFSSNRPGGLGNLDMYMTKLDESIGTPINLGKPINSSADDFAFIINNEKQKGYFSSNRGGGRGDDDVYSFVQITENPICDQFVAGIILDKVSGLAIPNSFVTLYNKDGEKMRRKETLADGRFFFKLKCANEYKITGNKLGYFENGENLNTNKENGKEEVINLVLEEREFITKNNKKQLNIRQIRYKLNRVELMKSSKPSLAKVVRLMEKYPKMTIAIGVHTDSRAPDKYSLKLSELRAEETLKYLVSIGADADRMSAKGYGETELVNKCSNNVTCENDEHLENRRVEFVVIKE